MQSVLSINLVSGVRHLLLENIQPEILECL